MDKLSLICSCYFVIKERTVVLKREASGLGISVKVIYVGFYIAKYYQFHFVLNGKIFHVFRVAQKIKFLS